MPLLDVTDLLFDIDFCTFELLCTRSVQTIGVNGLATVTQTQLPFTGVVTSALGSNLNRFDGGERISASIKIYTSFLLKPGTPTNTADVVTWNGNQYVVSRVNDYSQYGRGVMEAILQMLPLTG